MQMNGSIVLDTNIAVAFMAGDRAISQCIAESQRVILSVVVVGELFYGAQNSGRPAHNFRRVEDLVARSEVVDINLETARNLGIVKTALRQKGKPIPNNDIWLAAVAQQFDAALATRDAHFDVVEGITVIRW